MKKIFSLFLSLILVSSMILCSFSSAVFAADEEIRLAKELLDMTGNKLATASNKLWKFGSGTIGDDTDLFSHKVILVNAYPACSGGNDETRLQLYATANDQTRTGKITVSYGLYLAAKSDGELSFRARQNNVTDPAININFYDEDYFNLLPYKWYTIDIEIDLDNSNDNWTVKAKDENSVCGSMTGTFDFKGANAYLGYMFLWGSPRSADMPLGAPTELRGKNAFYAVKDLTITHDNGTKKAQILSVGSDGVVAKGQNEISFTLSQNPPTLQPSHILVKNKANPSDTIITSSASVQNNGGVYIVNATLERSLASWTNYSLEIGSGSYSGYKEIKSDGFYEVAPVKKDFVTTSEPLDIRDPNFSYNGLNFTAETTMVNTAGARDICFVLASYSHTGKIKSLHKKLYPSFEASVPGSDADISAPVEDGDIIRFFVLENMQSKKALFGKSWTVSFDGTPAGDFVSSDGENTDPGTIKLGDFDYAGKKIKVDLKHISSDAANGVLTVYSDASNPVFIDYITTKNDGSYMKEIRFSDNFVPGTYTVEFIPDSSAAYSNSFIYYTPQELEQNTRAYIELLARQAATSGVLMQAILGINENEEKINNNFDVFGADAKNTAYDPDAAVNGAYYELVSNKAEVFALMKPYVTQSTTYGELVALFNSSAKSRYTTENTTVTNPSVNNNTYGPSNTVVTENKGSSGGAGGGASAAPEAPQTVFSDAKGHWAERFLTELAKNKILNGYTDGTVRPENSITRAELAKLLSESFGNGGGQTAEFTDVAVGSWYYKHIANAFALGIITGYEDGSFRPDSFVTKQDAILMLYRAMLAKKALPAGYMVFTDDLNISSYAIDATRCLGELGIITGNENKEFNPQNNITRAEVAAVVCRSLDYLQSH